MKQVRYSDDQIRNFQLQIIRQMQREQWRPDYIVGLCRGGLQAAVELSHWFDVPCNVLKVSLREDNGCESNLWMAEDAFGYVPENQRGTINSRWDVSRRKKILIVDDINDSGATLEWIKQDWQSGCMPNEKHAWNSVWNHSVRFAVLINNAASEFKDVDYVGHEINKLENPEWCVFPWEEWWIDQG